MQGRGAAIQIVKPPTPTSVAECDGPSTGRGKKENTQRLCRNVLIYGVCKFQDQGCVYYHPSSEDTGENASDEPPPQAPATAAAAAPTKSVNLAAPVFVPKALGATTPRMNSPLDPNVASITPTLGSTRSSAVRADAPDWPILNTSQGLTGTSISYEDPSFHTHHSYNPQPPPPPQMTHHLYTPSLPFISNPPISKHPLHSFFIPEDLRHMIQARQDATYLGNGVPGLPHEVGPYHSLLPLDHRVGISKIYGYPTPLYRAVSSIDGGVYCLRRIEGYKVSSQESFSAMEKWRQMKHPNVVSLREAFTTKDFNDNSLVLVYDFHPNSVTLEEEHLNPEMMAMTPRRKSPPPLPERLLWSYITQIANAIKAVHSSGMALRGLDPSRIILTGKNRIRLTGVGILDVVSYDPHVHISGLQHDDLVSLGKLIMTLCCEWFVPGQHPAAPLDHISRHYSPDVKNLVMYLCGKPPGPQGKNIDEVVSILGLRILNEFDAMQNYNDMLESELGGEVENGRLVRLMIKLGFINERAEFELDPRWSDTGDRYILKLFRDFVFHSIGVDNTPILDLSHVLTCLNKLDAGLDEKIMLVSRDDQSCLVVTYREIKTCVEAAYSELKGARR